MSSRLRSHELRGALAGGVVAAFALFATVIGVGRPGSFEALGLIEAALPTARFLASTVVGSAVTTLALLLTIVGLSLRADYDFHDRLYSRVRYLTTLSVVSIVIGVLVLLAVTVPIGEVEELRTYYSAFYYGLAAAMAVLGGVVVSMGLLIGATLRGLLEIGAPRGTSDLLNVEDS